MPEHQLTVTYVGGPTALLELDGVRFLTDPTFDAAGGEYTTGPVTLRKTRGPALAPEQLGPIDAVLLSHDHHFDNLDRAGRDVLERARQVLTTVDGAARLGGHAAGLTNWQTLAVTGPETSLLVTGTPGRHGPQGMDRGPVTGFVLETAEAKAGAVYISGDTVWYEGVAAVARRFEVRVAILFMGAARVAAVGPDPLTMTASEGVEAARAFSKAVIVPLHFEDWAHFSEPREEIQRAFTDAGLMERLCWPQRGLPVTIRLGEP
jgi:L-ascorbate metabolism protein UlaG (beta-lactamase superfamily)